MKTKILIVDDERAVRDMLYNYITSLGFDSVDKVSSVESANTLLSCVSYDIVIVDYRMPGLKGDFLSKESKGKRSFIIGISASPEDEFKEYVDYFLDKPFKLKELSGKIYEHISEE